jgi:hypothetical protein
LVEKVQRNGVVEAEGPGAVAAEHGDMAKRARGARDVAGEAADVGALGDGSGEGDLIASIAAAN